MKSLHKSLVLIFSSTLFLTGCVSGNVPLEPQAQSIEIIDPAQQNKAAIFPYTHCELKGHVLANTVTAFPQQETALGTGEINIIKNKALTLGANRVIIQHNTITRNNNNYTHQIVGEAYMCFPSNSL